MEHTAQLFEFTLFPKLPLEIRLLIWGAALDLIPPSVVTFTPTSRQFSSPEAGYTTYSSQHLPVFLHVSKEAQSAALQRYTPLFSQIDEREKYTYFNPTIDSVYLDGWDAYWRDKIFYRPTITSDLAQVQHLVASHPVLTGRGRPFADGEKYPLGLLLDKCVGLKTLTVPCWEELGMGIEVYKVTVEEILAGFWKEVMEGRQKAAGVGVLGPPELVVLRGSEEGEEMQMMIEGA